MVQVEQQQVLVGPKPQQSSAHKRAMCQIEGPVCFLVDQPQCFGFARLHSNGLEVDQGRCHGLGRRDHLDGLPHLGRERGPQRFVPRHDRGQAPRQHGHVQRSFQAHGAGHGVDRAVRLQLVEEPEPLLGERERQRAITRDRP